MKGRVGFYPLHHRLEHYLLCRGPNVLFKYITNIKKDQCSLIVWKEISHTRKILSFNDFVMMYVAVCCRLFNQVKRSNRGGATGAVREPPAELLSVNSYFSTTSQFITHESLAATKILKVQSVEMWATLFPFTLISNYHSAHTVLNYVRQQHVFSSFNLRVLHRQWIGAQFNTWYSTCQQNKSSNPSFIYEYCGWQEEAKRLLWPSPCLLWRWVLWWASEISWGAAAASGLRFLGQKSYITLLHVWSHTSKEKRKATKKVRNGGGAGMLLDFSSIRRSSDPSPSSQLFWAFLFFFFVRKLRMYAEKVQTWKMKAIQSFLIDEKRLGEGKKVKRGGKHFSSCI